MKANRIGHSPSVASARTTGQTRAAAPTEEGPSDQVSLGGDWQMGDPLSALPERKQPASSPASWSWGDPISALPEHGQARQTEKSPLDPPSSPAGWHWGDPMPSW